MQPMGWDRLRCWARLAWTRVRPLRAYSRAVRASAQALWVRSRSLWGGLTYFEQFTIVALAALAAGGLGMVAFLIGIVGQASEEVLANRRAARDWEGERSQLIEQNTD